jgi:decaprenyl-phosphate phosphoribosyltransferase
MNTGSPSFVAMLRVKQWTKNLLIFLPLLLDNKFTNPQLVFRSIGGFAAFCLMASACYILNDIRDVDHDRIHPRKRKRQIASGNVSVRLALSIAIGLLVVALTAGAALGIYSLLFLIIYFLLNYFYSGPIKKIRYLDIVVLSSFYLLRLLYAWGVTRIMLTDLFLITCALLFLAASANKRYVECMQSASENIAGRGYSRKDAKVLRWLTVLFAVAALGAFNVHAIFILKITDVLWLSGINALAVVMFYLFFETRNNHYDDPVDRVLKKPLLLLVSIAFAALYIFLVVTRL